jgi:hypothetical protein
VSPSFDEAGREIRGGILPFHGVHLANGALLLGLWWWSWSVFPSLPDEIPGHIGPGGIRWDPATLGKWLSLPIIAAALTAFHYSMVPFLRRTNRFNLPSSISFDELLPGDQEEVRTLTIRFIQWVNAVLLGGFWILQAGSWETAMNPEGGMGVTTGLGIAYVMVVPTFLSLGFLVYMMQAVGDAERRARRAAEGEAP